MNIGDTLQQVIATESDKIDQVMRADINSLSPSCDPLLVEVLEYGLFNGGKRIRPLLLVLSARICGNTEQDVYELGKAFEYLHAATLFHDDVIDNAQTRRGRPAVNQQFGLVSAILAGDFLHARSMDIVGTMAGGEGLRIFCEATAGMVDGEFMQLRNAAQTSLSEFDYYNAIMGKTGLLIAAAAEVGALFARATMAQRRALKNYGAGIGCAFQMIDDLLDYEGKADVTGKAVGNDLTEGKMTLPLLVTLARANDADKFLLQEILANENTRKSEFKVVFDIITRYGGFTETRKRAEDAVAEASSQLALFADDTDDICRAKSALLALGRFILERNK